MPLWSLMFSSEVEHFRTLFPARLGRVSRRPWAIPRKARRRGWPYVFEEWRTHVRSGEAAAVFFLISVKSRQEDNSAHVFNNWTRCILETHFSFWSSLSGSIGKNQFLASLLNSSPDCCTCERVCVHRWFYMHAVKSLTFLVCADDAVCVGLTPSVSGAGGGSGSHPVLQFDHTLLHLPFLPSLFLLHPPRIKKTSPPPRPHLTVAVFSTSVSPPSSHCVMKLFL